MTNDKELDEESKLMKIKELESKMSEIEQQIQKRQLEKLMETDKENIEEKGTNNYQTEEEQEKNANIVLDRSIIAADINKERLTNLDAIRTKLINEDGAISERVKRVESMMGGRIQEINKSIDKGQEAAKILSLNNRMTKKDGESNNTESNFEHTSSQNTDSIDASSALEISSKQNKEFTRVESVLKSREYQNYSDLKKPIINTEV